MRLRDRRRRARRVFRSRRRPWHMAPRSRWRWLYWRRGDEPPFEFFVGSYPWLSFGGQPARHGSILAGV